MFARNVVVVKLRRRREAMGLVRRSIKEVRGQVTSRGVRNVEGAGASAGC